MAELLIRMIDNVTTSSNNDQNMVYSKGDVVAVKPDGFGWGEKECLPDFLVVKIHGSVEEYLHLLEPEYDKETPSKEEVDAMVKNLTDEEADVFFENIRDDLEQKVVQRRSRRVRVESIPKSEINEIKGAKWLVREIAVDMVEDKLSKNIGRLEAK